MRHILITAPIAVALAGIAASIYVGDIPRRPAKIQDRLVQEKIKEIEHEGRKFYVTKFREFK